MAWKDICHHSSCLVQYNTLGTIFHYRCIEFLIFRRHVPEFEVIDETAVPPTFTLAAVAPVKFVPLIVMEEPAQPLEDPKLVMVGVGGGVHVYVLPLLGLVLKSFVSDVLSAEAPFPTASKDK